MYYYKLTIAYTGTQYHGWQEQSGVPTIVGVMQERFKATFDHDCTLVGASRTDAGVHALGQVAKLGTALDLEPDALKRVLNAHLPTDIALRAVERCDEHFNPQYPVHKKIYYYHVTAERPSPFVAPYCFYYRFGFDRVKLEHALQLFVGTHDFRSFCTGNDHDSTVRTVSRIEVKFMKRFNGCRIIIEGPGFLRYMIRRMVGAALVIAADTERSVDEIPAALAAKNPAQHFLTASAQGLLLRKIIYSQE